jgi:hypothetical protein
MSENRVPPDFDAFDDDAADGEKKRLLEFALPEVVKRLIERAVETGVEKIVEAPENLRELVNDLKLPKEAAQVLLHQVDDTKKGVYRVVAKEIRDVLEHTNLADELAKALTKLQFEINTTIRFVPNVDRGAAREGEEADEEQRDESDEPPEAQTGSKPAAARGDERRPSKLPRPTVVSKVVMKARDVVAAAAKKSTPPSDE